MENLKSSAKKYRVPIGILLVVYLVGILAIIRANFYYIDDLGRAFWGYRGFQYFSRYVSEFGSILIHADTELTDISPLPQILATGIMAISGVAILHLITEKERFSVIEYIAMVPLCLSPYFLECISYKFDALYMAISVLASVAPALLYSKKMPGGYVLSVILGTLIMCMSYQSSSGIFPMLTALLALKKWNHGEAVKELLRFVMLSAVGYLVGLVLFSEVIMNPVSQGDYVSPALPPIKEIPYYFFYNLKHYYTLILSDLKKGWLLLIAVLLVGFVYISVWESKRKWYCALPMTIAGLGVILALAFGAYPAMTNPLFEPRAMYGFGVMVSMIAVYTVSETGRREYLVPRIACLALSWCFFIFAFTYGNALDVQQDYTDYRIAAVIDDLDETGAFNSEEPKTVQVVGTIGYAPGIYAMDQDYQILNRLIPILFQDSSWEWGVFEFENYYALPKVKWSRDENIDLRDMDLPLLRDSIYHTIRGNSEYLLIELKL